MSSIAAHVLFRRDRHKPALTGTVFLIGLLLSSLGAPAVAGSSTRPGPDEITRLVLVFDGPGRLNAGIEALVRSEVLALTEGEMEVDFLPTVHGDWTRESVAEALRQVYADEAVDLVLTFGLLASDAVCRMPARAVPTVAATVLDPELQGLAPTAEGTSGADNLVFIQLPQTLEEELRAFYQVVPFRKPAVVAHGAWARGIDDLERDVAQVAGRLGLDSQFVMLSHEDGAIETLFDRLETDVDAVFIWPQMQLSAEQLDKLIQGLVDRGLPSFSSLGRSEVEAGMLAGLRSSELLLRLARRTALNVQRILLGEAAADIPVAISFRNSLSINMATAEALGVAPRWETLIEASLVDVEGARSGEPLYLTQAVAQAVQSNLDLEARRRGLVADNRAVDTARATWRPQIDLGVTALHIDSDRAAASFGSQAERDLKASLSASQLLFSDAARANVEVQEALADGRRASLESVRLDVALQTAVTYLNLLRAQTLQHIRRNNLELTRSNLELSEARRQAGSGNPAEIYRWQSQIAQDRGQLLDAAADVKVAELALNRLLHRDPELPVHTVEVGLDDRDLLVDMNEFQAFVATPRHFRLVRDFAVRRGLDTAPDLVPLRHQVEALERLAVSARRAFYMPTVAAQLSLDRLLADGGAGADLAPAPGAPTTDDTTWSFALNASLPLFDGGGRKADKLQAEERLQEARLQLDAAEEGLTQEIRAASIRARTSYFRISLAEEAAAAARSALDLVADAYGRGAVSILDLLDSQNAALNAELASADAVYDFLIDLLTLERTIGSMYVLQPSDERRRWIDDLNDYFIASGVVPWSRSPLNP